MNTAEFNMRIMQPSIWYGGNDNKDIILWNNRYDDLRIWLEDTRRGDNLWACLDTRRGIGDNLRTWLDTRGIGRFF